ncbi:MAG: 2-succinyl-5-enolpyruvyl-6-hydroxy-3-cyclohexene-carboxylate synthase [Actinomycetota bacterium]
MTVQAAFCATIVDEWIRGGLTHAVIAPGSRSTPLAVALAARSELHLKVVVDERSAAFVALGVGLASGRPAVVLTTSGTAAAELLPAVVEAHHGRVPMLVATADRPWEAMDVRAPQTVDQTRLFEGLTRFRAAPGVPDDASAGAWRSLAARALLEARHHVGGPGPVHLNLAFREPLLADGSVEAVPGRADGGPWHRVDTAPAGLTPLGLRGRRGLVVAGAGAPPVGTLQQLGWPVLADPRSGARVPHELTVASADALLRDARFAAAHVPDAVLHVGEPWASRVVNEWLTASDAEHTVIDPYGVWPDPWRVAACIVRGNVSPLAEERAADGWVHAWTTAEAAAQSAIASAVDDASASGIVRRVYADAADDAIVFVASSMPVRDLEWFGAPREGVTVLSNRGANGIDGLVSTAAGIAWAAPARPVVGVLGDLGFLHDIGGLRAAARHHNLDFVVIDNDGGAIFDFLPQAAALSPETFAQLFATPHGLDLSAHAAAVPGVRVDVRHVPPGSAVTTHRAIHAAVASTLAAAFA